MPTEKLIILGKSDATITMILDNLESNSDFFEIEIVNNQNLPIYRSFENDKFQIKILNSINDETINGNLVLGGFQVKTKLALFRNFNFAKDQFVKIIHKYSSISSTSIIENGCIINSLVSIAAQTYIESFVSINRNTSIGHHTNIAEFVTINPGCNIAGNVIIGKNTQIGMGSNIVDGITIGENVVIGAGSLITKNVPDNVLVYGVPGKIIKEI